LGLAEQLDGQRQALLEVAEAIALHRDLGELFHDLAGRLHRVVQFDYLNLVLHDTARNVMRLHILETSQPTRVRPGLELPVGETPAGTVWETQQPLVVADIEQESRYPAFLLHFGLAVAVQNGAPEPQRPQPAVRRSQRQHAE